MNEADDIDGIEAAELYYEPGPLQLPGFLTEEAAGSRHFDVGDLEGSDVRIMNSAANTPGSDCSDCEDALANCEDQNAIKDAEIDDLEAQIEDLEDDIDVLKCRLRQFDFAAADSQGEYFRESVFDDPGYGTLTRQADIKSATYDADTRIATVSGQVRATQVDSPRISGGQTSITFSRVYYSDGSFVNVEYHTSPSDITVVSVAQPSANSTLNATGALSTTALPVFFGLTPVSAWVRLSPPDEDIFVSFGYNRDAICT